MKKLFELPLTEIEEYWCGLLHADGCIAKDPHKRLIFYQKELLSVQMFLEFLQQDSKITHMDYEFGFGRSVGYRASTRKGVEELRQLGVKSEPVPELYASRNFWRGMIDGDGTVSVRNYGTPVIWLCSGGPRDVVAFSQWVGLLFDYKGPKPYEGKTAWYACIGGGKARSLGAYLYKDSYSAVPRKKDVALSFSSLSFKGRAPDLLGLQSASPGLVSGL